MAFRATYEMTSTAPFMEVPQIYQPIRIRVIMVIGMEMKGKHIV